MGLFDNVVADLSFGLSHQALAVGQFLAHREPAFADYSERRYWVQFETKPWYNGRERGLCFVMKPEGFQGRAICFAVAECRNTDGIMVEEWVQNWTPCNEVSPVTRDEALGKDASDKVYYDRKVFHEGAVGKVADHIYKRMERHYKAEKKAHEKAVAKNLAAEATKKAS